MKKIIASQSKYILICQESWKKRKEKKKKRKT